MHQRFHTGEKPFKCQHCDKSFNRSSNLKIHNRTHTGEKPFKCKYCEKSYTTSSALTIHNRIHTGEKSFKYQQCSKAFTQQGNLIRHERIHTGERPYKCNESHKREELQKSFTDHSNLETHKETRTAAENFAVNIDQSKVFFPYNDSVQITDMEIDLIDKKPNLKSLFVKPVCNSSEVIKNNIWGDEDMLKLIKQEPPDTL